MSLARNVISDDGGLSSRASFVQFGIRMDANLRIIALFWKEFSGLRNWGALAGSAGRVWLVVVGPSSVPPLDLGWAMGGHLGCSQPRRGCAGLASDGRQHSDPGSSPCCGRKRGLRKRLLAVREVGSRSKSTSASTALAFL